MKAIIALVVLAPAALALVVPIAETADVNDRIPLDRRRADSIASSHINLQRIPRRPQPQPQIQWTHTLASSLTNHSDIFAAYVNSTKIANLELVQNNSYVATLNIGQDKVQLIVDTGSADTWILQKNFTCFNNDGRGNLRQTRPADCALGPPYNGNFQYGVVPQTSRFTVQYADGSQVAGSIGYQDVTLAGITVKKQEIALIDAVAYRGDGVTSGILGLAYPVVGRSFSNTTGSMVHRKYDPIFTNMYKQGLVSPIFSVAMDKKRQSGHLAFGGLPPVDVSPDFAKTPIRIVEADGAPELRTELSFYTIVPDAFIVGSQDTRNATYRNPSWNASSYPDVKPSQFPIIIDTGTTMTLLPTGLVHAYANQIPGGVRQEQGFYWALCNSTLPRFGVAIGGKTFYFRDEDMMFQDVQGEIRQGGRVYTFCQLGIVDLAPDGPYILGETFLNSVVSVFDIGASEMRIYARK